jgi:hypothetical protein
MGIGMAPRHVAQLAREIGNSRRPLVTGGMLTGAHQDVKKKRDFAG